MVQLTDENVSSVSIDRTKILVVVYGSLVTVTSAMLAATAWLTKLEQHLLIFAYSLVVLLSIAVIWIGYEVARLLLRIEVGYLAVAGTFIVTMVLSLTYLHIIGFLVGGNSRIPVGIYTTSLPDLGNIAYVTGFAITVVSFLIGSSRDKALLSGPLHFLSFSIEPNPSGDYRWFQVARTESVSDSNPNRIAQTWLARLNLFRRLAFRILYYRETTRKKHDGDSAE